MTNISDNIGIIIACRTQSTRLPGKALLPLGGYPMVIYLLERLRSSNFADNIVLATSELPDDDELASIVSTFGVPVFRGQHDDVVDRYVNAAQHFSFDYVVRVTADCPFVCSKTLDYFIERSFAFQSFDLLTTKGFFPVGIDYEIFPTSLLLKLHHSSLLSTSDREHLTLYMYNNSSRYNIIYLPPPFNFCKEQTYTVDTLEDYTMATSIVSGLSQTGSVFNSLFL